MHEISLKQKVENVLILDYNTVRLQSLGFIKLMQDRNVEGASLHPLDSSAGLLNVLNFEDRNITNIIDGGAVSEEEYFNFIKKHFVEVSDRSPLTHLANTCAIMSMQSFVSNTYFATQFPVPISIDMPNKFKPVIFDIFNIESIEKFIIDNNITSLFISDASMVMDIILNFNIKLEGFSFLISKIGYNLIDVGGASVLKYQDLHELSNELDFKIALVDLYNSIAPDATYDSPDIDSAYDEFDYIDTEDASDAE